MKHSAEFSSFLDDQTCDFFTSNKKSLIFGYPNQEKAENFGAYEILNDPNLQNGFCKTDLELFLARISTFYRFSKF